MRGRVTLLLAAAACSLAACGPVRSAGDVVAAAPAKIDQAQEAYQNAKAFVGLFLDVLPADRRAAIETLEARIETAIDAARIAATIAAREAELRKASKLTAELAAAS